LFLTPPLFATLVAYINTPLTYNIVISQAERRLNMERSIDAVAERPATTETCRHHWIIETPSGPFSKGVCKLCGEERVFENLYYGYSQVDEPPKTSSLYDLVDMEGEW
jgi:hypothetical protein